VRHLDLTLPTAAENLALDEALLEEAEAVARPLETLRLWEPDRAFVVIGRSSKVGIEVREQACREMQIPIVRRVSGGAAVVAGPGCLMYALVLSYELRPALRAVAEAHQFVLNTVAAALEPLAPGLRCRGTSDLCLGQRKVSGNSMRAKRTHLLYHGTLLYDFPLDLVGRCLAMPPRQPAYRNARTHEEFVANLPLEAGTIRRALTRAWGGNEPCPDWPREMTARLVAEKYSRDDWNAAGIH
jgi:lipoate-protein ligase A